MIKNFFINIGQLWKVVESNHKNNITFNFLYLHG